MKWLILAGITILIFCSPCAFCLAPAEQWNTTFHFLDKNGAGWPASGASVQQTNDGGYIILATAYAYGSGAWIWLIKTDSQGKMQWNKTFNPGAGSVGADGNSVRQTNDGGYIIAGGWAQDMHVDDPWLIKTNSNGELQWAKIFRYGHSADAFSIKQTNDMGYIATGPIAYDWYHQSALLIRTDTNGNELWNKTFGGISWDASYSVQQSNDGGYILAGYTNSYGAGSDDVWLIKTDTNGDELWNKTFGGTGADFGYSVQQTSDGGYIIAGSVNAGSERDAWLIKTDSSGNKLWDKHFGNMEAHSVQQTSDGGYIFDGWGISPRIVGLWLVRTDAAGNILWDKEISGGSLDYGDSVQQTSDGGYILTGESPSYDVLLIKVEHESVPSWSNLGGYVTSCPSIAVDNAGKTEAWVSGSTNQLHVNVDGTWKSLDIPVIPGGLTVTSDPFAVKDYNGKIHVLVRGSNGHAMDLIYDPVASSAQWKDFGGGLVGGLTGAQDPHDNSKLRVAVRGTNNALFTGDLNINTGTFGGWVSQGGVLTSRPCIMFDPAGNEHVLVRSSAGTLCDRKGVWTGSSYTRTWNSLGGGIPSGSNPAATIEPGRTNNAGVIVKGNDNAAWFCDVNSATSPETYSWYRLGGGLTSDPFAVADSAANKIHIFVRGTDSKLYEQVFSTNPWTPTGGHWYPVGGVMLPYTPGAVIGANTQAFVVGTDHALWRNTHDTY